MTVYADILIIVNFITDYFILLTASRFLRLKRGILRLILSALIGGISSLYIFAPVSAWIENVIFRAVVCIAMTLSAFGYGGFRCFMRRLGVLSAVTACFGGIMTAAWYLWRPKAMTVVNSVVYFDISPGVLIFSSVAAYAVYVIFVLLFSKTASLARRCSITVFMEENSIMLNGIIDTGNSVGDAFGLSEVIIVDKECIKHLFGEADPEKNQTAEKRFRILPCSTVGGETALEGYRCDRALVCDGEKTVALKNPVLAISKVGLNDGYGAIVNPEIFIH